MDNKGEEKGVLNEGHERSQIAARWIRIEGRAGRSARTHHALMGPPSGVVDVVRAGRIRVQLGEPGGYLIRAVHTLEGPDAIEHGKYMYKKGSRSGWRGGREQWGRTQGAAVTLAVATSNNQALSLGGDIVSSRGRGGGPDHKKKHVGATADDACLCVCTGAGARSPLGCG